MASPKLVRRSLTVKFIERDDLALECRREIPDATVPGLYFIIQSSGHKSFAYRYRIGGRNRKLTIGTYPRITLAEARKCVQESAGLLAGGGALTRPTKRPPGGAL